MADKLVHGSVANPLDQQHGLWGPYYITASTGIIVFMDAENDLSYARTTDKGVTWTKTQMSVGTVKCLACWFDRETPGDTGDLIHIAWLDRGGTNRAYYRTLNIADETLGTERTVDSTVTISNTNNLNRIAITKTLNGNLIYAFSTQSEIECYRSVDAGVNWVTRADVFEAATQEDYVLLYPANTGDNADAGALFWDRSADIISLKMYDDSANSWTETNIATSMVDDPTHINMDAAVRHSDKHVVGTAHNSADTTGDDLITFDLTLDSIASPTITLKTNVFTNQAESAQCAVIVDQNSDDIYIAYFKGAGTWEVNVDLVFRKSTDGLATWGTEQAYSEGTADDFRRVQGGRTVSTGGGRIQWSWFNDDLDDILVNLTNDIEIITAVLKSLAGSVTPTGALSTNMAKAVSGSVTPTGGLAMMMLKSLAGSVTPTGALNKLIKLPALVGSVTATGALAFTRLVFKTLTGSVTPTGALSTTVAILKSLAGSVTPTGALSKLMKKSLSGSVTPTGILSTVVDWLFKWAIDDSVYAEDDTVKKLFVEISPNAMPAVPSAGQLFDARIKRIPRFSRARTNPLFGISGFGSTTIRVGNYDGLLNTRDIQGAFARITAHHEGGAIDEFRGIVTKKRLDFETDITIEDLDQKIYEETIPKRVITETLFPNAKDLGEPISVIFSRAKKVKCHLINEDNPAREFDYLIGEGVGLGGGNMSQVYTAYREDAALDEITGTAAAGGASTITIENADRRPDGWYKYFWVEITSGTGSGQIKFITGYVGSTNIATVDSAWTTNPDNTSVYRLRPWRFYDGSQSSPHSGFAFLRFKKRLGDNQRLDNIYADVEGFTTEINVVRTIESILTNSTWGLGLTITQASFDTAAALSDITALKCEGPINEQARASDVLESLLAFRGMTLTGGDSITIAVDASKTSAATFGLNDGFHDNIISQGGIIETSLEQLTKDLVVNYEFDSKSSKYRKSITRSVHSKGNELQIDLPFVIDPVTADRIADFRRKRLQSFKEQLSITVGLDGELISSSWPITGNMITVLIPDLGLTVANSREEWEIIGAVKTLKNIVLTLMRYKSSTYTYEALAGIPSDATGIPADSSLTDPDPVSNLAVTTGFANDRAFADLTWTLPEDFAVLGRVFYRVNGDSVFLLAGEGETSFRVPDLTPGMTYDFQVLAVSDSGRFSGAFDPGSIKVNILMPGDTTAPAKPPTPSLVIARFRTFKASIATLNSEADFSHYEWQRTTTGGSNTGIILRTDLGEVEWTETGTSVVSRKIKVRAIDDSGNASAYTSLSVSASTATLVTVDIGTDEVVNHSAAKGTNVTFTPAGKVMLSTTITKITGTKIRVECALSASNSNAFIVGINLNLRRATTIIEQKFVANLVIPANNKITVASVFEDTLTSSGTYTYDLYSPIGISNAQADTITIRVVEYKT